MMKSKYLLELLTALFTGVSVVNSIIRGSGLTLVIMAVCALYACWINYRMDKERGDYE